MERPYPSILVVDDDMDTCRNLADILGDLGYQVDIAHDGPAALERVRDKAYDIALLDLKMPGMDGVTLYREIKRRRSGTVAIIVTAYASSETAHEALTAGAWQILSKPVEFPKLLGLVDEALSQPLVLVVDGDQDLSATLWDLLRERGYRVYYLNPYYIEPALSDLSAAVAKNYDAERHLRQKLERTQQFLQEEDRVVRTYRAPNSVRE